MKYLEILKKPFNTKDMEGLDIAQTFITLGITLAIFALTNGLIMVVGTASLGSVFGGSSYYLSQMGNAIAWRAIVGSIVGFAVAVLAVAGIVFAVKRRKYAEYTFINALSGVASSLVLPITILPVINIPLLISGTIGTFLAGYVIMISFVLAIINFIELLLNERAIGKGKAVYISSASIVVFYMVAYYISYKVVAMMILSSINSMFY